MGKMVFVMEFEYLVVRVVKDFLRGMGLHMAVAIGNVPPAKMPPLDGLRDELPSCRPRSHAGRWIDRQSYFCPVIIEALVTRKVRPAINSWRVKYRWR